MLANVIPLFSLQECLILGGQIGVGSMGMMDPRIQQSVYGRAVAQMFFGNQIYIVRRYLTVPGIVWGDSHCGARPTLSQALTAAYYNRV